MSTPYSTSRLPRVPNPTPSSSRRVPRAPIYNPYDQFTQPEFDAWIGDITGALKRVLGREEPPSKPRGALGAAERDEEPEDEDVIEDSFADVRARRAAKGKERAVDEGDDEAQPIVLSDDSEGEQTGDDNAEAQWGEPLSGEEYSDEEASGEDESDAAEDQNEDAEEIINLLSDDDEDGGEPGAPAEEEVFASDEDGASEEEEEDTDDGHVVRDHSSAKNGRPYLTARKPGYEFSEHEEVDVSEEEQDGSIIEEESIEFPQEEEPHRPVDLSDPWDGPNTFAEDFYSGGDVQTVAVSNPHILPAEEEEEIIDVDADEDVIRAPPVELPDPWDGPRRLAEDFYAEGELRDSDIRNRQLSPSHLTPREDKIDQFLGPAYPSDQPELAAAPVASRGVDEEDTLEDLYADLADGPPLYDGQYALETTPSPPQSPQHAAPTLVSHVDWNWPPAFNNGRSANRPGHLESEDPSMSMHEVYEISDDEDDEGVVVPLGTSDLDVPTDFVGGEDTEQLSPEQFYALFDTPAEKAEEVSLTQHAPLASEATAAEMVQQASTGDFYSDLDALLASDDIPSGVLPGAPAPGELDYADIFVQPLGFTGLPDYIPVQGEPVQQTDADSLPVAGPVDFAPAVDVEVSENDSVQDQEPLPSPYSVQDNLYGAAPISDVTAGADESHGIVIEELDDEQNLPEAEAVERDELSPGIVIEDVDEQDAVKPEDAGDSIASGVDEVDIAAMEYNVTEPHTEGQRTEEPDAVLSPKETNADVLVLETDTDHQANLTIEDSVTSDVTLEQEAADLSQQRGPAAVAGEEEGNLEDPPTAPMEACHDALEQEIAESVMADTDRYLDIEEDQVLESEEIPSISTDGLLEEIDVSAVDAKQDSVLSETEAAVGGSEPEPEPDLLLSLDSASEAPPEIAPAVEDLLPVEVVDDNLQHVDGMDVAHPHIPAVDMASEYDYIISGHTFESGVPMPISADPEVQDPTSVSHTPLSPSSPVEAMFTSFVSPETLEDESQPDTPVDDSAYLLAPSGSALLAKGTSGLFTPLDTDGSVAEEDSQPTSPDVQNAKSSEQEVQGETVSTAGTQNADIAVSLDEPSIALATEEPERSSTPPPTVSIDIVDETAAVELQYPLEPHEEANDAVSPRPSNSTLQVAMDSAESPSPNAEDSMDQADTTLHAEIRSTDFTVLPDLHGAGEHSATPQVNRAGDVDTDAEGDIDSDYLPENFKGLSRETTPRPVELPSIPALDDDPFKLMGSDSKVAPGPIEYGAPSSEEVEGSTSSDSVALTSESRSTAPPEDRTDATQLLDESTVAAPQEINPGQLAKSDTKGEAETDEASSSRAVSEESRPRKRKRQSAVPPSSRRTRSMADKGKGSAQSDSSSEPRPTRALKGKGKRKDKGTIHEEDELDSAETASIAPSQASDNVSVRSGTSFSSRMLASTSRSTSRASSTNPDRSDNTSDAQSFLQDASQGQVHQLPAQPLIDLAHHRHGKLRTQTPLLARRHEDAPAVGPSSSRHTSAEPGPSQPAASSRPRRDLANSPATRSQCRFWRISLPCGDETWIDFVAPRCTLTTNEQFMKEQGIINHKETGLDKDASKRLVGNVESLDLSSYLLGVLRQLVGIDLFRENEVYYLPKEGEKYSFKTSRRRSKYDNMPSSVSLSALVHGSPRTSRTSHPSQNARLSAVKPPSQAGSTSTTSSGRHDGRASEGGSLAPGSISEDEGGDIDADAPPHKRQKTEDTREVAAEIEAVENELVVENKAGPSKAAESPSAVPARQLRPRKGKPLGKDAAAYKPEEDSPGDSAEEDVRTGKRKNKRKGVKRNRTDDSAEGQAENVNAAPKRRRVRATASGEKGSKKHREAHDQA
ncbi:hypothetical protein B0H21DRAFT_543599 [Amylocystis lapponica]|nr:hypothetical protein B0H21DRAFT_543599 [Amylocystis lapponica]